MTKYAFVNGIILDGSREMQPLRGRVLLVEGDTIRAMPLEGTALTGYQVVDLNGQYLMPGLINLHVHLPGSGKPSKKKRDLAKLIRTLTSNALLRHVVRSLCEGYARTQLFSGVTTIRTMGGIQNTDTIIRDRIAAGKTAGPRILAANMAVSVPGGHMAGSLAYEATSAEQAAAFVRSIAADKPDVIKLMITGGVLDARVKGEPGVLKMPPEYVRAACEEAHRLGLPVAAHVESPEGVRVALENGVDTIEHGAKPDEEIIRLFRQRGACQVATLSPALPYALFDRSVSGVSEMEQYNGDVVFRGIIDCARACLQAGVPVGLGTDTGCPYITHYNMWREVFYFQKYCGVSNAFALYTATAGNAAIAGLEKVTGSIQPGLSADLIVTRENPLEDLRALRQVSMVMAAGRLYRRPKVKKLPEVEKELDKFL